MYGSTLYKNRKLLFRILLGLSFTSLIYLLTPDKWKRSRIKTKLGINPKMPGLVVNDPNSFSWYEPIKDHFIKSKKILNHTEKNFIKEILKFTN